MSVRDLCQSAHRQGHEISEPYVYQLLQGRKGNPSYSAISAIADGFGVPAAYFFDDVMRARVDQQLELFRLVADTPVKQLYFRAIGLSDDDLANALEYVRYLRHRQGLPPLEDRPDVAE